MFTSVHWNKLVLNVGEVYRLRGIPLSLSESCVVGDMVLLAPSSHNADLKEAALPFMLSLGPCQSMP